MSLTSLGLSALNAAQQRLAVTGHNINNANTEGYSRQSILASTAGSTSTGSGFIGRGVQIDTVTRSYNDFLSRQYNSANSKGEAFSAYGSQIAQIANLMGDRTVGISPAIQSFFEGVNAVASTPADPAARQELITRTESMVGQFNSMHKFLEDSRNDINGQISTIVKQVNSYSERIASLNYEIQVAEGASGHVPNDLYDQRDLEVSKLNELVGVSVLQQGNQISVTIGNGQLLVSGKSTFALTSGPSPSDPRNVTVFASVPSGAPGRTVEVPLSEDRVNSGTLGGLMSYRRDSLDPIQRQLGQLSVGLGLAINQAQANGVDLLGNTGIPFFNIGTPDVVGGEKNLGSATVNASINLDGASEIKAADYSIKYDGTNYTVLRMPEKSQVFFGPSMSGEQIDGMTLTIGGAPVAGDTWTLMPVTGAAGKMQMALTSAEQIAAAGPSGGSSNGDNALAMAKLQTSKILGEGTMSFNESYSQIVNRVGVQAQQNTAQTKAQKALIDQSYNAQQSVSGVNLNEENVNLQRYIEQFAAASKIIEASGSMFDTLLSIRS